MLHHRYIRPAKQIAVARKYFFGVPWRTPFHNWPLLYFKNISVKVLNCFGSKWSFQLPHSAANLKYSLHFNYFNPKHSFELVLFQMIIWFFFFTSAFGAFALLVPKTVRLLSSKTLISTSFVQNDHLDHTTQLCNLSYFHIKRSFQLTRWSFKL